MKKLLFLFVLTLSHGIHAEDQQAPPQGAPQGQQQGQGTTQQNAQSNQPKISSFATTCSKLLETARATAATPAAPATSVSPELMKCRAAEILAQSHGDALLSEPESMKTSDSIATCTKKAGYTSDYDSCTSTANLYNSIVALEKILLAAQQVRYAANQQNIQTTAATQIVEGDGQNAIYDATLADNEFKKGLNREQLLAYTTAVAAMGTKLASWKTSYGRNCKIDPATIPTFTGTCQEAFDLTNQSIAREVKANSSAKTAFSTALVGFLAKVAKAKAAMDALDANSAVVSAAQDLTSATDSTVTLETCVVTPLADECISSSGRTTASTFSQGDVSFGDGTGNNAFDLTSTDDTSSDTSATTDGNGVVSDVSSPFNDEAKNANDILDPASAASVSPGGSSSGGSGGVGGGLGGGGSASLGNDLKGEDTSQKAAEVNAKNSAGNYKAVSGQGFRAVAASAEENPFKSLFDSEIKGGIEDDGSISANDGGVDSGLFRKISLRYQKVSSEKRIEALE